MGSQLKYALLGYVEIVPTESGFVTPVFVRNKQCYFAMSADNVIERFVLIPEDHLGMISTLPFTDDYYVVKTNKTCYLFKHGTKFLVGDSVTMIRELKKYVLRGRLDVYLKKIIDSFITKFDTAKTAAGKVWSGVELAELEYGKRSVGMRSYLQILLRIDKIIRGRSTGTPAQMAIRLGISERSLYDYLKVLKDLGAPVKFSRSSRSYYYQNEGEFHIAFVEEGDEEEK